MKKVLDKLGILLLVMCGVSNAAMTQAVLCGWDGSGSSTAGDEFSFVLLRDYNAGEIIYFTEDEYSVASGAFLSGEGHIAFTVPTGGLLENEVINITESSDGVYSVGCTGGTATHVAGSGNFSLVTDGLGGMADEIYSYSASNPSSPWNSVTDVHSFAWSAVVAPPADQNPVTDWPLVIDLQINIGGGGGFNGYLQDAARVNTTVPVIQNITNWLTSTGNVTLSCTDFTNQMLPIELRSFEAFRKGDHVKIEWVTESEINNEMFVIEHSVDGISFRPIGTIKGSGTSYEVNTYHHVHKDPSNGINYYRIKQVDYDGAFSYSDVVFVRYSNANKTLTVYPNPFVQEVTIELGNEVAQDVPIRLELYDIYGQIVQNIQVPYDQMMFTLDLTLIKSGTYIIHVIEGGTQPPAVHKIVKL